MFAAFRIVEIREGGAVCAGVVMESDPKRAMILLEDGREVRVANARILDDSRHDIPQDQREKQQVIAQLRQWRETAEARATEVDLAALHSLFVEQEARSSGKAATLSLNELALLSLGENTGEERAAVHRALALPNAYFKFSGRRWTLRSEEEVAAEQQRLQSAAKLAREREDFTRAARERLNSGEGGLPEHSEKFVRLIREVAIHGEAAKTRKEATALVADIKDGASQGGLLSGDHAFSLMVKLGLFSRDENLPLLRAGVKQTFPEEVLAEAEELASLPFEFESADSPPRRDLRDLEVITIDDVSTTEVDDGLSLVKTRQGLTLGIHIADAAHFVPVGSLVDEEARERSTTYYLPGHSLPMLPSVIAEGAASLVEGEDRPAISFLVSLTPHFEILDVEIVPSLIRVTKRMSYEDCEAVLAGETQEPGWLKQLLEFAEDLASDRHANGATTIRSPELSITFDDEDRPVLGLLDPGRPARRLVSEMMILANKCAAEFCAARSLSAIYRKQGPPSGNAPLPPIDHYDSVAVNAFRRTLQRTVISLDPGPHAGLGLPAYVQGTSPIRRYQDLVLHRLMKASLTGSPSPHSREDVMAIAASTEKAGRQARKVENETDDYWVLRFLEENKGELLSGVVIRTDARRTHVELDSCAHRVSIPTRPDHSVGDALQLKVQTVNPRLGSVSFSEE